MYTVQDMEILANILKEYSTLYNKILKTETLKGNQKGLS